MYCTKQITDQLVWVGGNDRKLSIFEGVYFVPYGVSYNSYLFKGEKNVLFDTVDKAVSKVFFENLKHELNGNDLDFVVVQHMEPDHSATLEQLVLTYPNVKIICNAKIEVMLSQFFDRRFNTQIVKEGDELAIGGHTFKFIMAPMVHWPEVMMTYDMTDKILFSADAFGHFGALNGSIFADQVNFNTDYMNEARRYYANIVGKYGMQVQSVLNKASSLEIKYICPLHGFVWRKNLFDIIEKYIKWSTYTPEERGVLIAYASIYGNTENVAEIISSKLNDCGIKTVMYDTSTTPASEIISEVFRYSHLVIASTTYNAGIFVQMESFLHDLVAHNIQNRTIAIVENGSWAATSGKLIKEIFEKCKNLTFIDKQITIKSSLKEEQLQDVDQLVSQIKDSVFANSEEETSPIKYDAKALYNISYGLYVLTAKEGKDNGCIINTVAQVSNKPNLIAISVNKQNYTHHMICNTGRFNISILSQDVPFDIFEHFGFKSGKDTDKFINFDNVSRSQNDLIYLTKYTNSYISCKVVKKEDCGSHTLFTAEIEFAEVLNDKPSVTYSYYFANIKPKPVTAQAEGKIWVCKYCGYAYSEEVEKVKFEDLPNDWVCPLCKHSKSDFEL